MNPAANGFDRLPVTLCFEDRTSFAETYGYTGSQGLTILEGMHFVPRARPSRTLCVMMHPSSTLHMLPIPGALAAAGVHVLCAGSRYPKNDAALIMEKVLVDLGVYVRHAREVLGYGKVVLIGWSGGGSLAMSYQAEAEHPTITTTPAGDPVDLTRGALGPADGAIFIAAHASRARFLRESIDPSVLDEHDPDRRDRELDIYDPGNPNQPPYPAGYLARYRAEQLARMRRITARVRDTLEVLRRRNDGELERGFVVHRTMADPRWRDVTLDPNDRPANWCYLGDPRTVNNGPVGLGRFCTLRSWLSQWSVDDSRIDAVAGARRVRTPILVMVNSADDACPASHGREVYDAAIARDKSLHTIAGANHYYKDQPEHLRLAVEAIRAWLGARGFID
jgi:pimeloyl-ACP methyl ester carboxylesterase